MHPVPCSAGAWPSARRGASTCWSPPSGATWRPPAPRSSPSFTPTGRCRRRRPTPPGSRPTSGSASIPTAARCSASYYAGYSYESAGGRRLAELLQSLAAAALEIPADGVEGMSLPVLRETRMPAVICEVGPPATVVVARAGPLAQAIVEALTIWAVTPVD